MEVCVIEQRRSGSEGKTETKTKKEKTEKGDEDHGDNEERQQEHQVGNYAESEQTPGD